MSNDSAEKYLTLDEVSAMTGDDIMYWLDNPFMSPEMVAEKVCWWVTRAMRTATDEVAADRDPALRFRVETACDGYSKLWESDVLADVFSMEDYLRGAHDAAEAIRGVIPPA